ncbi:uncharacterized protein CDAR_189721 [Caerostris darwini]|uniref:Uncharacterized protein n=1 Tax=Caerostris darwini TaxID=1538125 RepID=A0AAV4VFQ6_9ARAC|nr:uncharacterized protein CDAR_189721 [Caerostris darwini]
MVLKLRWEKKINQWDKLIECLGSKKVLNSLPENRWSDRSVAVSVCGHKQILEALMSITDNKEESRETRSKAINLSRKMKKLEVSILTEMWRTILEMINKTNVSLQKATMTMNVAINLLISFSNLIDTVRNNFDEFESSTKEQYPEIDYKDNYQRKRLEAYGDIL